MELYVQDENFEVIDLIETFDSLIWTERYAAMGDFELVLPITQKHQELLDTGTYLAMPEAKSTMVLESVNTTELYKVKGRSLECLLERRVVETAGPMTSLTLSNFVINLVLHNIGDLASPRERVVPNLKVDYTIPSKFKDSSEYNPLKYGEDLYTSVKSNCDLAGLGFRMVNPTGTSDIMFVFYYGQDLTAKTSNVIFSESMGNIMDTSSVRSTVPYKNVAVVNLPAVDQEFSGGQFWHIAKGDMPSGINRREVWSDASDLRKAPDLSSANVDGRTMQWGLLELIAHPLAKGIDFQLTATNQHVYDKDYTLGDIVMVLDNAGETNKHQVTEYIRSISSEGTSEYPTLSAL